MSLRTWAVEILTHVPLVAGITLAGALSGARAAIGAQGVTRPATVARLTLARGTERRCFVAMDTRELALVSHGVGTVDASRGVVCAAVTGSCVVCNVIINTRLG